MCIAPRSAAVLATSAVVSLLALNGIGAPVTAQPAGPAVTSAPAVAAAARHGAQISAALELPGLRVRTVVGGLDHPWDLAFLPGGDILYTEREQGDIWWRGTDGTLRVVAHPADLWVEGETGLMSIAVADDFADTRVFWTCQGANTRDGRHDVQVVRWKLNEAATRADRLRTILHGLPTTSGRHGGCRLEFGAEGALYIGTGEGATTTAAQDKTSGGGKVLRVRRSTGAGWPGNPYDGSSNAMKRRVFTYGHRNVQGLTLRSDGRMWSAEHGSDRDDEVNLLRAGGNYGWDPAPDYDHPGPMTDFSLPGRQVGARWKSGNPTLAISGATWLTGRRWQGYRGRLVVAALKNSSVRMLRFAGNDYQGMVTPPALDGDYGRLRTAVVGPRDALYFTTDNGGDRDRILKVTPR
jgi:glucose/arabinose dehydrogenase